MTIKWAWLFVVFLVLQFPWTVHGGDKPKVPPLSPEEALKSIQVPEGLQVELFASEPHVMSPVAMAFDENGRVYIVEMGDYPLGKNGGCIKLLEDSQGAGRIDRSTVLADGLPFPNGVMPWKGGIFVTSAPDLLYFKDTKGTGKADVRQVIFTGFAEANPQHRFNTPTFGIDNWIYGADGESATGIRPGIRPDAPAIPLRSNDFRFRPDFSRFEAISGRSQFAMTFDDWGNRFINTNNNHIRHPVLPQHYLERNPYLAVPEVVDEIAEEGKEAIVYPISKLEPRFNDPWAAGRFTSACSVVIYRGDALPAEFRGNAFVCEPVHNLVHRDLLVAKGTSFAARSAYKGRDFLASTDNWFRPVNLTVGPDGALYVVDMYRAVIEHPQWIPLDIQKKLDLRAGNDRGRIYRIVPKNGIKTVRPQLGKATAAELVALFENANAWWRMTAQRLLIERQDSKAIEPLRKLARTSKSPLARLHALWTMEGLGALENSLIEHALQDAEPGLREHGLRLAEARLADSAALQEKVLKLAEDENLRVRFQAAFTLGALRDDRAIGALARIAVRDGADRWVRMAVLSSVPDAAGKLLAQIYRENKQQLDSPNTVELVRRLAGIVGARRQESEVRELLQLITAKGKGEPAAWQLAVLSGLGESLRRSGASLKKLSTDSVVAKVLQGWRERAVKIALSRDREVAERVDALRLLIHMPSAAAATQLRELLGPQEPNEVQIAAVRALAALPENQGMKELLGDWNTRSVPVRREILTFSMSGTEPVSLLLDALEGGAIRLAELDPARRDQLLRFPNESIRERARKLLASQKPTSRQKVAEDWTAKVLPLTGDAVRGQKVYATHCANCHRLHGQGVAVGPDLATVNNRSREALVVDILDPNRAVDPSYVDFVVVSNNGQVFNGLLAAETASSITLRRAERQETTVLRRDIAEIHSTGVSLMPEGMENIMTTQDLADLIELLRRPRLH
jgi:putative membrane-bound dehydrogenase-like protein